MLRKVTSLAVVLLAVSLLATTASAVNLTSSLDQQGTPDLKSAGPLAFGPDGILFVGDTTAAVVFAIDTGDTQLSGSFGSLKVTGLREKVASLLGTSTKQIKINDLAVNPASGKAYLSVSRGTGPKAVPVLLRVNGQGKVEEVSLKNVKFAKADLPNPVAPRKTRRGNARLQSITDMAYVDGRVFVAGLSNEEFASNLRAIPFPFKTSSAGTSVEIFHGAHGRFETRSPVRTFTHYKIKGEPYLLAAYTCTPLVKFPVAQLKAGSKLKGTTIAELGNRNNPLDMFVYNKDGKDYILLANSSRGVMKITTENLSEIEGIESRISGTAGLTYETLDEFKGVLHLDRLDAGHALLLVQSDTGSISLETIALP